jgi:molybdenum-dependent DNA-binding transcriptional regulator ModE
VVRGLSGTSISEGAKDMGNGWKEATVKIDHAKESLESGQISRRRKRKNWLDLGG